MFELRVADAVDFLASIDDETVDCIVTDPAYESLEEHRAKGTTTRLKQSDGSSNEWFDIFRNERFPGFFAECFRVLKPDAHLYVMSDQKTGLVTKPMAEAAGFAWWKFLVWAKTGADVDVGEHDDEERQLAAALRIGMGYHYRSAHEWVGFYEKGKLRLNDLGIADVLPRTRVRNGYPTEKPVSLARTLIAQSTQPGQLVVDPFLGSGSTGEAALRLERRFAGCDTKASAVDAARARLARYGAPDDGVLTARVRRGLFE